MPSVRDLVARVGDALKQSEFRGHPDLYRMDQNLSELSRINWSIAYSIMQRIHDGIYLRSYGHNLKSQDLAVFRSTEALLSKLRQPSYAAPTKALSDMLIKMQEWAKCNE